MHPEIVKRPTETVLFVREFGDYTETPKIACNKLVNLLRNTEVLCIYGMGLDNPNVTASKDCRFDACAKVLNNEIELAEGVQKREIDGGHFAVFTHKGQYAELGIVCNRIFQDWFPSSGYNPSPFPLFCEYTDYFDESTDVKTTRIYVPIQA